MELQREEALSGMGHLPELPAQSQTAEGECIMVQHHTKYIELHGVDEVVEMSRSDHELLHRRLRREGMCDVPVDELRRISVAAKNRGDKHKACMEVYRAEHREQINARARAYRVECREQINARRRASRAARKLEAMKDEPR